MPMRHFFTTTALLEMGAGVALMGVPSVAATLLLGAPLEGAPAFTVAGVGGAGLLALGVACWFARGDAQSGAAAALATGMLLYNLGAAVILGAAGARSAPGIALWPAVILHAAMGAWCLACLRTRRPLSGRR